MKYELTREEEKKLISIAIEAPIESWQYIKCTQNFQWDRIKLDLGKVWLFIIDRFKIAGTYTLLVEYKREDAYSQRIFLAEDSEFSFIDLKYNLVADHYKDLANAKAEAQKQVKNKAISDIIKKL